MLNNKVFYIALMSVNITAFVLCFWVGNIIGSIISSIGVACCYFAANKIAD
jgi:hypothetical protein